MMWASTFHRWLTLSGIIATMSVIWLIVLPAIAHWPTVEATIARHHQLGIDPSAKFYSELDATEPAYESMQSHTSEPEWWRPF
ncbi:hypothetical protein GC163_03255 [bacterium]|nr:hypothetical protein [bacterium]